MNLLSKEYLKMTLVPTYAQQKTQLAQSKPLVLCMSKVRKITVVVVTIGQFHTAICFDSRIIEWFGMEGTLKIV